MEYQEFVEAALKGRSVNSMAKVWGLKQQTLDRYVKGTHLPDYRTAMLMAQEAGVAIDATFILLAQEESKRKKAGAAFAVPALAAGVENTTKNSTTDKWSGERIRTSDSCVPNAVLYQAELRPDLLPTTFSFAVLSTAGLSCLSLGPDTAEFVQRSLFTAKAQNSNRDF